MELHYTLPIKLTHSPTIGQIHFIIIRSNSKVLMLQLQRKVISKMSFLTLIVVSNFARVEKKKSVF